MRDEGVAQSTARSIRRSLASPTPVASPGPPMQQALLQLGQHWATRLPHGLRWPTDERCRALTSPAGRRSPSAESARPRSVTMRRTRLDCDMPARPPLTPQQSAATVLACYSVKLECSNGGKRAIFATSKVGGTMCSLNFSKSARVRKTGTGQPGQPRKRRSARTAHVNAHDT